MNLASPGDRVKHIVVFRGDIEVAHQHQLRVLLQIFRQPALQRLQPGELVDKLVSVRSMVIQN
ncbi:MAG: hypothetical protein AB3X44_04635 [Leptothrix sp. (in: b-proteobacteria)]